MLLTRKILIDQFKERLKNSHSVDIAVAWAGQCDAVRLLCDFAASGKTLRVIVGLAGNGTDPVALQKLYDCARAQVRIAEPSGGIFHPKFYLFHEQEKRIAWVGSANLTNGGFSSNDELVLEVLDKKGLAEQWFSNLWNSIPADAAQIIASYKAQYARPQWTTIRLRPEEPPAPAPAPVEPSVPQSPVPAAAEAVVAEPASPEHGAAGASPYPAVVVTPADGGRWITYLQGLAGWPAYVEALQVADQYWPTIDFRGLHFSVLGNT